MTQPWNCLTFVHPSYRKLFADTDEINEHLFIYLKEDTCFDEVVHDEEDVDEEVSETEPDFQIKSQGRLGHSSRWGQLLAKRNYIGCEEQAPRQFMSD